jgi:enoyl-CoA hydratase
MRRQRAFAEIILRMRRCPQPIITLLHGATTGAGLAFALTSDVRYSAEGAKMNVAMSKIGVTGCDIGISYFLPRAVGTSNAAEMMMGGRFVDASKALRIGLVSDVVAPVSPLGEAGLRRPSPRVPLFKSRRSHSSGYCAGASPLLSTRFG